jgi:hypothetical protein
MEGRRTQYRKKKDGMEIINKKNGGGGREDVGERMKIILFFT